MGCRRRQSSGRRVSLVARLSSATACGAFTLLEIMVAVSLLVVIMLGLMAMFTQTQKAFRAGMTQVDVLEGGRAAVDLLGRDLEQLAPSYTSATNFYARVQPAPYVPLVQPLPGFGHVSRQNILEDIFFLTRENQTWYGVGYRVVPVGAGVGTLYRFVAPTNIYQDPAGLMRVFANTDPLVGMSRFLDGVVHFKARAFDRNGTLITSTAYLSPGAVTNSYNYVSWSPALGDVNLCQFTSNTVPAYVEVEIGVLETPALDRYKSFANAKAQQNYLQGLAGQVHVFRRRISINSVDPLTYP
jgi:hypothetical protein